MEISDKIFKAYDIRGMYPDQINEEAALRVGKAIVAYTSAKTVLVGRDVRLSTPKLANALTSGIMSMGANVVDMGEVSTPEFYFALGSHEEYGAGVMITASHNPKDDNGFKLEKADVVTIGAGSGMEQIKELAMNNKFDEREKGNYSQKNFIDEYISAVLAWAGNPDLSGLRAVVDFSNGMATVTMPEILDRTKCDWVGLCVNPDGTFPNHIADPMNEDARAHASRAVVLESAAIGILFDGDADRVGFFDEKGQFVSADHMFLLIARELIKKYPGAAFVHDLLFTKAFGDQIKELGGVAYESKVGHAFVKNRIRETGAIAGAEFSTHFNFKENYGAESSEYAALLALKILKESGKKLSELVLDLKKYYHSGVINFHAHEKDRIMADMKTVYSAQARKVSDLDGYKFTFDDWWFCVRPSNTEPVLRLVVEADTENLLDEKLAELQEFIHSRT